MALYINISINVLGVGKAQLVENLPAMWKIPVQFLGWEDPWRRDRLPTRVFLDFSCGSARKESTCNA